MDSLDGSHGPGVTYLPVVYEDDCQVCSLSWSVERSTVPAYAIEVSFLRDDIGADDSLR